MENEEIYIFGHRKPDTDSVTSAISLSYLKNKLGFKTVPMVLGEINRETEYVLNYFKVKEPKYLNDVKLQIKDVDYQRGFCLSDDVSVNDAYDYMVENGVTGVPIVDKDEKFSGLVTVKNVVKDLISGDFNMLHTSYENILKTLDGEEVLKFDEEIQGNLLVASYRSTTFLNNINLDKDNVLIVGDRHSIIEYAVSSAIKLMILVGDGEIKDEHLEIARSNHVNIIRTKYDTFHTTKLIGLSNYVKYLIPLQRQIVFDEADYYDYFISESMRLKHNNYPVVDKNGKCKGLLRITGITKMNKKKVILVDHNESEQSAIGLDEAEIVEVVDHHKIGNISTNNPINFRNMSVGSTNTIVYQMFLENKIAVPKDIAGLMLSGILSDTLVLTSPTTTEIDKKTVLELAEIADVNYNDYALEMFKAGTSLEGKTKEEIIGTDIKSFPVNELKFAVSQVFTLNYQDILNEKEEYIKIIEDMASMNDYALVVLAVTDIISNGSYIIYTEKSKEILESAFGIEALEQGYYIDGCVSRKKQIVPPIMEKLK